MSSAHTRTPGTGHLELVHSTRTERRTQELVVLPPSERLAAFIDAAAARGIDAPEAVRLGVERALALADAALFGLNEDTAASRLRVAAARTRPRRELAPTQAAYVRGLSAAQAVPTTDTSAGLRVSIPERVLARARSTVSPNALRPEIVPDMISWEIAATLEGRYLGEWALSAFAETRRAA